MDERNSQKGFTNIDLTETGHEIRPLKYRNPSLGLVLDRNGQPVCKVLVSRLVFLNLMIEDFLFLWEFYEKIKPNLKIAKALGIGLEDLMK